MARHSQGEAQRRRAEEPSRSASACMGGAGLFGGGQPPDPVSVLARADRDGCPRAASCLVAPHKDRDRRCRLRRRQLRPNVRDNWSRLAVASSSTCTCAASLSS
jgi:hypothetical protein